MTRLLIEMSRSAAVVGGGGRVVRRMQCWFSEARKERPVRGYTEVRNVEKSKLSITYLRNESMKVGLTPQMNLIAELK